MVSRPSGRAVAVAGLAGAAGVAGSYAVAGFTRAFVVAPVNKTVVDTTPGIVLAYAIQYLGALGHQLGFLLAVGLTVAALGAAALAGLAVGDRLAAEGGPDAASVAAVRGVAAAVLAWALAAGLTGRPVDALAAALPPGAVVGLAGPSGLAPAPAGDAPAPRRRLVVAASGVLGFAGLSYAAGTLGDDGGDEPTEDAVLGGADGDPTTHTAGADAASTATTATATSSGATATAARTTVTSTAEPSLEERIRARLAEAESKAFDVEGIPGLVSEIGATGFYEVDINTIDPSVDAGGWELAFTGAVENPRTYSYDDITGMTPENRFVTLRCVGDDLNGPRMDNALWTGVPISRLLEAVAPTADASHVMFRAADGFFEEFPVEALHDGFLAYGMNGEVLPEKHGYPVRALVPGHWGEINVKWLTEVELLTEPEKGYWEQRGWHGTGPVNTVAKLWTVNRLDGGVVQVAGHAYAGTRGVERVEVSTDGGDTWAEAALSPPLEGDDVWRQWKYEWEPPAGRHVVVVRAVDGTGTVQPREESDSFPSGPTGWVSRTVEV